MDLVWPAFGAAADTSAPAQAIGGTVDQSDLDGLKQLLDATGWKVTLGMPLKSLIDPAELKNPAKDPAPQVTMDQVVGEVKAAHATLGDDLLSVEVGNEYDNVTTLTPAEMWSTVKHYQAEIDAALPHAHLKMTGPSANTALTNSVIDGFADAALADGPDAPRRTLAEMACTCTPTATAAPRPPPWPSSCRPTPTSRPGPSSRASRPSATACTTPCR